MRILLNLAQQDKNYQGFIKEEFKHLGHASKVTYKTYSIEELMELASSISADAIYCTNPKTVANLVPTPSRGDINLGDWRGSTIFMSTPVVIGQPLAHIRTTTTGKLLFQIDLRKLSATGIGAWKYNYTIAKTKTELTNALSVLSDAAVLTVDIETTLQNQISSIAFTEITNSYEVGATYTISLMPDHWRDIEDCYLAWEIVRKLCATTIPKVFHNGCFDTFHLLRYHCVVNNYLFDTEYIWHCWYAELPKALAKIASYILPDYYYWKYESELNPLEYNAKDTINTARIFIKLIQKAPRWVWKNYSQSCPNIAPVVYTCFEGFKTDTVRRTAARKLAQEELDRIKEELEALTGFDNFNPGSWQQVQALIYKILRAKVPARAKSAAATGELELTKVARQHPLFELFTSRIIKHRELKKAIGTYYDARLTEGNRLLYSMRLDGTETSRFACSASSLYAPSTTGRALTRSSAKNMGTQLQNIPPYLKTAMLADDGYLLIDTDKSQSEARCTAYLAGSESLREALENPPEIAGVKDFYCYTGYRFFGIEFGKEHELRQAVKKIIHGTNYIMGWATFIDSIGIANLQKYRRLVGMERVTLKDFAIHLLSLYHELYPEVKQGWNATVKEVATTGRILTPDGWTRIILGDISSHTVMRSCVAHKSQHFSVVGINEALWKLFYFVQVGSKGDYRLKGQIHDSIISQAVEGKAKEYARKQEEVMDIAQSTKFGEMRIPLETSISYYWKPETQPK